jgi:hypothetical protein
MEEVFDFFLKRGCTELNANPVFEHLWTEEEAALYYKILIKLANRLLESDDFIRSIVFTDTKGMPLLTTDTTNYCGGTSAMLAFDPDGIAYPCLRYMESSLGTERKPIIIGDCHGIYNTPETQAVYNDMKAVTRQS